MTPALTITEFLDARITEDEAVARAASVSMHGQEHDSQWDYGGYVLGGERDTTPAQDEFITTWWPARVLAECAAKRGIVQYIVAARLDRSRGDAADAAYRAAWWTATKLAAVYKDHPDYRQEWAL